MLVELEKKTDMTYLTVDDSVLCVLQLGVEVGIVGVRHGGGWSVAPSESCSKRRDGGSERWKMAVAYR